MQLLSIVYIPAEKIKLSDKNPFKPAEGLKHQKMIKSIRLYGLMQPLIVYPDGEDSYLMLAGHDRFRAAVKNGERELPCIIWRGNPTAVVFDSNTCSRSLSEEEIAALNEDEWKKEFINMEVLPKLIPKLAELYAKGELPTDLVIEIASNYSQEKQLEFLSTFSVTEIVEVSPDEGRIEELENQIEKLTKDLPDLSSKLTRKDTELIKLRKEKDRLTEQIEEISEELEEAKTGAQKEAMKELGKDLEEFKNKWSEVSYKLKAKETEIENLKSTLEGLARTESAYLAELNATKMQFQEKWSQREKDFKKQMSTYSRPDLIIRRFRDISEVMDSFHQQLSELPFTESAFIEMKKSFSDLVVEKVDALGKLLNKKMQDADK